MIWVTYINAAIEGNDCRNLIFRNLRVYVVALTGARLRPGEEDNKLTAQEYLLSRVDIGDEWTGSVALFPVSEKCDAHERTSFANHHS